jgi:hypothetical protein
MKRWPCLCIFLIAATLLGQGPVTVFGTIADSTGAAPPNVAGTVANTQTGAVGQTVSTARAGPASSNWLGSTYFERRRNRLRHCAGQAFWPAGGDSNAANDFIHAQRQAGARDGR